MGHGGGLGLELGLGPGLRRRPPWSLARGPRPLDRATVERSACESELDLRLAAVLVCGTCM